MSMYFLKLDRPLRAQDEEPPVAPDREAVLREPVDANEPGRIVGSQQDLPKILEFRRFGMIEIGDVARHDLGLLGSGEEQKLLDLMRADVAQNAAGPLAAIEPVRARVVADLVRPEADRLQHAADRALP